MVPSEPLLDKAKRFIRSAQILAADGDAEALLEALGFTFNSHRAVISTYGQQFTKTTEIDPRFHQSLVGAFSQRQIGDYSTGGSIRQEDIDGLLIDAQNFLHAAQTWLETNQQRKP